MQKNLYAYAWDFAYEGLDTVLERIKAWGIDGIAMAVTYHAGKFILPHNPRHRVYFPEDGTAYFIPDDSCYPGPIKPVPASFVQSNNMLADVADGCKRFGLKLTAWTVCMHNTRLGYMHPEITVQNVYGDRYPYCLCPAQPQAAEYVLGLISDLASNYDLDTIFLEALGYMGFPHGFHHEFYGIRLNTCHEALLGLCFCDACSDRARQSGIDIERTAQIARENLMPIFTSDTESDGCDLLDLVDKYPDLAEFLKMRSVVALDLLSEVRRIADGNDVKVDYFGPSPYSRALPEGTDTARAAAIADHYVIPVGSPDPGAAQDDIEHAKSLMPSEKIIISINMGMNSIPDRENFREKMALLQKHNLAGCNLYNYSILPFERLDWIKE